MIEWIISSSVLILVIISLRFILRGRVSLRLQYGLWAIVLLRLALPVSLVGADFSLMEAVAQTEVYEEIDRTLHNTQVHSGAIRHTELSYEEAKAAHDGTLYEIHGYGIQSGYGHLHTYFFRDSLSVVLGRILRTVWLLGAVSMALYLLGANLLFGLTLRKTRTAFDCTVSLPVYISSQVQTPCLYGLIRPAIYLTEEVAADEAVRKHVLAHEMTHYRHWDHVWSFLRCACLALHWYNPLVWWAAFLSRRDAELACDEGTIRRLGENERISYGSTLIGLSCTNKTADGVLLTATTMTGSKRSIRERIVLIAKKPRMALITLIVVLALSVVAAACTFTGAEHSDSLFRRYPSFTEWTESLTADEIQWAEVAKDYGVDKISYTLTDSDYAEVVEIFKHLGEDDFTRKNPGGASLNIHLSLYRQDKLWLFKCLDDGTVGLMFNDPETGAYFGCEGRYLIIYSKELWNYIENTVEEKGAMDANLSTDINAATPIDISGIDINNIPGAAIDYAEDYVQQHIDHYNDLGSNPPDGLGEYSITASMITKLEQIDIGTAGQNNGVVLYLLEYRLQVDHPENILMAGGMSVENGWLTEQNSAGQPYLLLHYEDTENGLIWERVCVTNTDRIEVDFGTPEMLEKYGSAYTAAAMQLYGAYKAQTTIDKSGTFPIKEFADELRSAGGVLFILEAVGGKDYIYRDEAFIDELELALGSYKWKTMDGWPDAHGEICQAKVTIGTPDWNQMLRVCSCGSIQYVSGDRSSFYYSISDDLTVPHPFDFLYEAYMELDQAAINQ